ncbi:MAG TPA: thermonuclease family protein [Thermodesulfobacteriota bacterium]|nr:thermonuclease family protein [Thermodesulfobacteriota bacterium]
MRSALKKIILIAFISLAISAGAGTFFQKQLRPFCFSGEFPSEAAVAKVIDGDTIVLDGGEKVRYLGINAPEIRVRQGNQWITRAQICGKEAKDYNQKLVEGKRVRLEYDQTKRDDYSRILAYVWDDGVLVNGELLKKGLALVDVRYPNLKHQKMFFDFQKEARDFHRGIWEKIDDHTFSEQEAFKLIGEIGVVQGTIVSVNIGREKVYLHFGKNWENDFTGIIYKNNLENFPWRSKDLARSFLGRKVKIYGFVKNSEGPAIIISAPSQVDILN